MKTQFTIKPFTNPSGAEVFRVWGYVGGKLIRANFKTHGEALTFKQNKEREAANLAPLPTITTRLTSDQAKEAEAIYHRLDGQSYSLGTLLEFALKHYAPSKKQITVEKGVEEFLQAKRMKNLRPESIRNLSVRCGWLTRDFGEHNLGDLQAEQIKKIIFTKDTSPVTQDNNRRALNGFFAWAVDQEYMTKNPLEAVEAIETDRDEPKILNIAQCRALIYAAETLPGKEGLLTPYLALALFCAIRPTEVSRLTWDDIDLEANTVTIGAKIAKMRGRRVVSISDNALAFLMPHATKKTPLVGVNWRKDFDAVKEAANDSLKDGNKLEWIPDVLRHTGISMHLETHQHEGKTAIWAGNSPDIIQRHYKGLVKTRDAAEFWQIMPGENKILNLKVV